MGFTHPAHEFWVTDFSPGFLDTPEEDQLPGGATPDARNSEFTRIELGKNGRPRRASLRKRKGSRLLNPTVMDAAAKVDGLFEFRRAGVANELVAICNGKVQVYDDVDTFVQVGATAPFTPGRAARACLFRNHAFIHDGSAQLRYNGTALLPVGQVKPTGATNMAAIAPTGAGLTGTYEAYYVWYDVVMDHESSPSPITAPLVLAAQARRHTKPAGVPAAHITHWRAYVRRTDTNEFNFYRAGTFVIGAATGDEETSDTARREAGAGPFSSDNDPPPGAWSVLVEWKGFGIGLLAGDDSYYLSKQGDLESWHPRNKFPVSRGDGDALTSVIKFGTDILLHKGHSTIRLVGEQIPLTIEPLHSRFGNVSQESALEVNGVLYAWDRERGPYQTDTVNWTSLVDGEIATILTTINRAALWDIRASYDEQFDIIRWAVATIGSTRKRLVLKYHVGLGAWLPPESGLEYGSLCTFTPPGGVIGTYLGDYWGRVYALGLGDRDGPISGTLTAAVSSATASTVTALGATFYVTGSGLAGMPVAVRSPTQAWQWRRILSNTADTITLDTTNDTAWTTIPTDQYEVVVGGIQWYQWTPEVDFDRPELKKSLNYLFVQAQTISASHALTIRGRFDDADNTTEARTFAVTASAGLWGELWGVMVWGGGRASRRTMNKQRVGRSAFSAQFEFSNFYPDQPFDLTTWMLSADPLPGRKSPGVGV